MAVTKPVQKISGLAKGVSHGASALFAGHDLKSALAAGRDAAGRRERELGEELSRAGRSAAPAPARPEASTAAVGTGLEPEADDPGA